MDVQPEGPASPDLAEIADLIAHAQRLLGLHPDEQARIVIAIPDNTRVNRSGRKPATVQLTHHRGRDLTDS